MGLLFYPRGGSAQVARYLARALETRGHRVTLATGSLGPSGSPGNADTFFSGLELVVAAYDDALAAWQAGDDPLSASMPMHPSFEPKDGVADRCFDEVSPARAGHASAAWRQLLGASERFSASDLLHLHHLGPLHAAAAELYPSRPVVTHLHGTELKFLARVLRGGGGTYGAFWAERMIGLARQAAATICISPHDSSEAARLLGLDPDSITVVPNGVDVGRFRVERAGGAARLAAWRRWLVEEPLAWIEDDHRPGALLVTEEQLRHAFLDGTGEPRPVLLYVGRFLAFKRVPLLVRAYARARREHAVEAPLVVWGGAPGEWEGEHPATVARACGLLGERPSAFFVGWRGHDELPDGLACADVLVAPSVDEPFGQVYLEAMSAGLPVIGTSTGGPPSFVNIVPGEEDGWLIPPDDEEALAEALARAVAPAEGGERRRRGENAARHVRERLSWETIAARVESVHDHVLEARGAG